MTTAEAIPLGVLYERDETAWLEAMSELIRLGRLDEVDYPNLAEYLADMARRDRREVESRLTVLIAHALKWAYQTDHRSGNWRGTSNHHPPGVLGPPVPGRRAPSGRRACCFWRSPSPSGPTTCPGSRRSICNRWPPRPSASPTPWNCSANRCRRRTARPSRTPPRTTTRPRGSPPFRTSSTSAALPEW